MNITDRDYGRFRDGRSPPLAPQFAVVTPVILGPDVAPAVLAPTLVTLILDPEGFEVS